MICVRYSHLALACVSSLFLLFAGCPSEGDDDTGDDDASDDDVSDDDVGDDDVGDDDTGDDDTGDDDTGDDDTGDDDTGDDDTGDDDTSPVDADGDGYDSSVDCDDNNAAVNPGAAEVCDNGVDDDCDAATLDLFDGDSDGDDCSVDCDDGDAAVGPSQTEVCDNGVDDDCDAATLDLFDLDGDGSTCDVDCDDAAAAVFPGATETCNAIDDDCDSSVDEGFDVDNDTVTTCGADGAPGTADDDCDDGDDTMYPGATELCDGLDNDCDGSLPADEADADGDLQAECEGDCDDGDTTVYLGADELCDGIDNSCDGVIDEHCPLYLVDADAILEAGFAGEQAGWSVSGAGDVNGDGYDDLLVGARSNDAMVSDGGAAYLVHGPVSGTIELGTDAVATIYGVAGNEKVGTSVSGAGDVNNDGFDDILVGAPEWWASPSPDDGAAFLFLGPVTGTLDEDDADAILIAEGEDWAGYSVSGAGDVNNDGYDDILVGAMMYSSGGLTYYEGAAYLVLGPVTSDLDLSNADAKIVGSASRLHAGTSVSGAGDVNNDGYDDILVGASGAGLIPYLYPGSAHLFLGPVTGTLSVDSADAIFMGLGAAEKAGESVAGAGDVNGDGFDDILVGAPEHEEGGYMDGAAYLFLGPVTGLLDLTSADATFVGDSVEKAGQSVSGAGDVNDDGYADILIGGPLYNSSRGRAHLIFGPVSGTVDLADPDGMYLGEPGDDAGRSVSSAGDVNGDGYDDFIVGATYLDGVYASSGGAYVVLGGP